MVVISPIICASCKKNEANNFLFINYAIYGICDTCQAQFNAIGQLTINEKTSSKNKPDLAMQERRKSLAGSLRKLNQQMEHKVKSIKQNTQNNGVHN